MIDPSEVTILQLGEQSTRLLAMKAGQLEARDCAATDHDDRPERRHARLMDMSELGAEFQITGLASSQNLLPRIVHRP